MRLKNLLAALLLCALSSAAMAQSNCIYNNPGDVLTPGQWAACWQGKTDFNALGPGQDVSFVVSTVQINTLGDTAVPIVLNGSFTRYRIVQIIIGNASGVPSGSGRVGVYTAPSRGGTTIAAQQILTGITTISANTSGNAAPLTFSGFTSTTAYFNAPILYFNVGTINGSSLTLDVSIQVVPLS